MMKETSTEVQVHLTLIEGAIRKDNQKMKRPPVILQMHLDFMMQKSHLSVINIPEVINSL